MHENHSTLEKVAFKLNAATPQLQPDDATAKECGTSWMVTFFRTGAVILIKLSALCLQLWPLLLNKNCGYNTNKYFLQWKLKKQF